MAIAMLALAGCSSFSTLQTDTRTNETTGETTTVTTRARSYTFFDSKSSLAKWKAAQTEKSQGAEVGGLTQDSSGTNVAKLVESIASGVVQGLGKSFTLKP